MNSSAGPRIIAIGDIHGCAIALQTLLEELDVRPNDTVVVLGDFIDRGPDTRGVIDQLIALRKRCQLVLVQGNHEEMFLQSMELQCTSGWLMCGGQEMIDSYGGDIDNLPGSHCSLLQSGIDFYETDDEIFTHANYNADLPMDQQRGHVLRWRHIDRDEPFPHHSGKTVVVGHTPQSNGLPLDLGYVVCIDTNACGGGWLTAFDVTNQRFVQANENRQVRRFGRGDCMNL